MRLHPARAARAGLGLAVAAGLAFSAIAAAQTGTIGLSAVRAQLFDNEDLFLLKPAAGDLFAWALATGDFDGDGADDLASGIPQDDGFVGAEIEDCGAVVVRYGGRGVGLRTGLADTFLHQLAAGSPDPAGEGDRFGFALAACDFNRDGRDDLAVGIPNEDHLGQSEAGAIQIHYGSSTGLRAAGDAFHTQSTPGVPGDVEAGDHFGYSLACGDFNGDGYDDLAIGAPHEDDTDSGTDLPDAGIIDIIPGSAAGLNPAAATALNQDSAGIDGGVDWLDEFGFALAAGNFDGGCCDDLAIGVPNEVFGDGFVGPGAVNVVFGNPAGLSGANPNFMFSDGAFGEANENGERFAHWLASGDFDGDGKDDLAIGVPLRDLNSGGAVSDAGQVDVIYGKGTSGLDFDRVQVWTQGDILGPGTDEAGDRFAAALATGDFDADGNDDLAVGHPGESTGILGGAVTILMGTPLTGLTAARHREVGEGQGVFPGVNEAGHSFGRALSAGDYDGDGHHDLAIGAPHQNANGAADVGAEMVLYGSLHSDGFDHGFDPLWLTFAEPASTAGLGGTRYAGNAGLAISVDPTHPAFVRHDIPAGAKSYRARFFARLWPLAIAANRYFILLDADFAGSSQFSLYVNRGTKENGVTAGVRDNSGALVFAPLLIPVPDGWRSIEVDWKAATPGASDGRFDLWIDGHFFPLLSELDNSNTAITSVRWGAVAQLDPGTSGTFHLDEYESKRFTRLGQLSSFADAPLGDPQWPPFQALFNGEVTAGCDDGRYCPQLVVSREQIALFLLKSKEGPGFSPPPCTSAPFTDVPTGSAFCRWIRELANRGIVSGCGDGRYCPQDPVSRQQAAVLLVRTLEGAGSPPSPCTDEPFADVSRDSEFCPFIHQLASDGITQGCGGGNFCPHNPVTRAQLAPLLIETFDLLVPEL